MFQGVPPIADSTFRKKLKEFDKDLTCEFDRWSERFIVLRQPAAGKRYVVHSVRDDAGGFRQPDDRDIATLWQADLWRHGGVMERILSGEKYMREYRERQEANVKDELRNVTKDNKYWLRKTLRQAANDGKANHEFRRIEVKPKGHTVNELRKLKQPAQPAETV